MVFMLTHSVRKETLVTFLAVLKVLGLGFAFSCIEDAIVFDLDLYLV